MPIPVAGSTTWAKAFSCLCAKGCNVPTGFEHLTARLSIPKAMNVVVATTSPLNQFLSLGNPHEFEFS